MLQILIIFLDPECHYVRGIWCVTCDYSSVVQSKLGQTIESSCYVCPDDKQRLSVLEQNKPEGVLDLLCIFWSNIYATPTKFYSYKLVFLKVISILIELHELINDV